MSDEGNEMEPKAVSREAVDERARALHAAAFPEQRWEDFDSQHAFRCRADRQLEAELAEFIHGPDVGGNPYRCLDCFNSEHACACGEWLHHGATICGHCRVEFRG